jgi:hypothetical protein
MEQNELLKKLEAARLKYKPAEMKAIFVAEAPPDGLERFFYYENVQRDDWLFLGIIGVLYPEEKEKYLKNGRRKMQKAALLRRIQADGYYLLDLYELPMSLTFILPQQEAVKRLCNELTTLCDKSTPIILIKANVYDEAYSYLKEKGFNVIKERIAFPSSGQQTNFKNSFTKAIKEI